MEETAHIALLPTPGMGHLIPLVEFAKRLIQLEHYKFSVTVILPTTGPVSESQLLFLEALPNGISYIALPPINVDDLSTVGTETRIALTITRSLPAVEDAVKSLVSEKNLVALVVDLFGTDAFDIAKAFGISSYVFFPTAAINLSIFLHMSELDKKVKCEYRDMIEPVKLPGCIPINGKDLLDPLQDRKDDAYKWTLHHASRYKLAEGIVVNTFEDLEPEAIKALREENGVPPLFPVGPLTQKVLSSNGVEESDFCLKWLNNQPVGSVLFVSFGSGGTLTEEQFLELAMGLELSEQRFIWVVRSPSKVANAAYFNQLDQDPFPFLPKGYLDRVKGCGLVVADWAPQAKILNHGSTGGFLTHCGWNSILESVVSGIPLVAWPLYAEQRTNAVMLSDGLKVALRPKSVAENGLIGRVEIARVVKSLIEGEEGKQIRSKMRDLKDASVKVLGEDGSSTKSLLELASKWKSKNKISK